MFKKMGFFFSKHKTLKFEIFILSQYIKMTNKVWGNEKFLETKCIKKEK